MWNVVNSGDRCQKRAHFVTSRRQRMPRFLTGDELGSIKSVSYDPGTSTTNKLLLKTLHDGTSAGRARGVQKLAISRSGSTQVRVSLTPVSRTRQIMSRQVGFGTCRWHPLSRISDRRGRSGTTSRMEGDEIQSGPVFRRSGVDTKVSGKRVKLVRGTAHQNIF